MGGLTREEAEQRIEQDTGDADDEVWTLQAYTMGRQTYHNDCDCQSLQKANECRSIEREQAQRRLFAPCKLCVIGGSESA